MRVFQILGILPVTFLHTFLQLPKAIYLQVMKTNTDHFANLYYRPRGQKSKVKTLLSGNRLPDDVADLLRTAFAHYHSNDDETAGFYLIELCEAVQKHLGEEDV